MNENGAENQHDRLFLSNRHDIVTAHHATVRYGYADNAGLFLEKILWLYDPEEQKVDLEGAIARVYKDEIIDSLDFVVAGDQTENFVAPARGLLRVLRDS